MKARETNGRRRSRKEAVARTPDPASDANPWIGRLTDRIVAEFAPLKVILFGSHARGDAEPGSDIDLVVVLSEVQDKRLAAVAIRRALSDLPVPKDIIVTCPEEIARRGNLVGTVLRPALREGRVLYERRRRTG